MKLKSLSVRNFRSYTNGQGETPHTLTLCDGLNVLVGPNNCGKSNLLRAVSLALQDSGGAAFNLTDDVPSQMPRAYPVITLGFSSDGRTSVEKTLLHLLEEYERSAGAKNTNAANGEIILRVTYRSSTRDVAFGVKGMGHPLVPTLEDILSGATITVKDSADTALLNKGTGVRGALLVGLLTYLAKHSRRSLVLAVEEPESFLHPRAQQDLRDDLMKLAKQSDVSLLVTTHSPFMLSRSSSTTITALSKSPDGHTVIGAQIRGDQPHSTVVTSLFGETITPALLDLVQPPKEGIQAILFVERYTDKAYIDAALHVADRLDLLDGLDIRYDEGAHKAAVQAILVRQMLSSLQPVKPIGALFDSDEMGKSAKEFLTQKFNWNGKHLFGYRTWKPNSSNAPVEAEDMFDEKFLKRFVASQPPCVIAETMQYKSGAFHYGFTQDGKEAFLKYLDSDLTTKDVGRWIEVLEDIRKGLGLRPKPVQEPIHREMAAGPN